MCAQSDTGFQVVSNTSLKWQLLILKYCLIFLLSFDFPHSFSLIRDVCSLRGVCFKGIPRAFLKMENMLKS